jgi:hypothetical protein
MAENIDPFFVIDDSGSLQNLLVVKRGSGSNERVLPYSLAELVSSSVDVNNFGVLTASINDISSSLASISSNTGVSSSLEQIYGQLTASYNYATASYDHLTASSGYLSSISSSISSSNDLLTDISSSEVVIYNTLTASHDQLTASNVTLTALSQSADRTYNYLTAALEQITSSISESTNYLKEINAYCRATHVSSSIFSGSELQGLDLAQTNLIPDLNYNEQYLRACVDVLIQNSTNKNCYIKVSHLPNASISPTDYTIKLPPGVIYNSEAQIASMRHAIYVTGSEDMYGEVSAMMTYNSALRSDASLPNLIYPNTIKSLAVNAYNFYNSKVVLNEYTYAPQGTSPAVYDKMVIVGQARVSEVGEKITLSLESGSFIAASASITSTEPQTFIMESSSCPAGRYEFIAHGTDLFAYGNGRVLFADLLITTGSV